jgi:hypothetical protein
LITKRASEEFLKTYSLEDFEQVIDYADNKSADYEAIQISVEPEPLEDGTHYKDASQYTVEIPDYMVFIDESKPVENSTLKNLIRVLAEYLYNETPSEDKVTKLAGRIENGKQFYEIVTKYLNGEEKASLWLAKHGVDGMVYEGEQDGLCWVIYNCDKLKIVAEY